MRLAKYFRGSVTPGSFSAERAVITDVNSKIEGVRYPAGGLAQAYHVARGEATLDGSNPTVVATGLTSVIAFIPTLKNSTGLTLSHVLSALTTGDGNASVYAWKSTGGTALIASTGVENFYWMAIGTYTG